MKLRFLSLLLISFLVTSCGDNRVRKKTPVPPIPGFLVTGCYYIVDDSTAVKRSLPGDNGTETYYLNPDPIFTVGDFQEVKFNDEDGRYSLNIILNEKGTKAFAVATKKYTGKMLAFVIYNRLVMAPRVADEISGGRIEITGGYETEKYQELFKRIESEMYEQ